MASSPPLILLPPSEGKAPGGSGEPWCPGTLHAPELDPGRVKVGSALKAAMRATIAARTKLLGVKGDALGAASETNRLVASAPTMEAIRRYTGVLYGELAYDRLSGRLQRRVDGQVRILSALWGVVAPTDLIPDYKLKMGASLPRIGRLAPWWRPQLSAVLDAEAEGRTVWNLLPNEHAAAWVPQVSGVGLPVRVITVRFLDETPDPTAGPRATKLVGVNHWNKLLKGALVRHILAEQLSEPAGLTEFLSPHRYEYRPDLTVVRPDGTIATCLVKQRGIAARG